jgi:hypothetical protein
MQLLVFALVYSIYLSIYLTDVPNEAAIPATPRNAPQHMTT